MIRVFPVYRAHNDALHTVDRLRTVLALLAHSDALPFPVYSDPLCELLHDVRAFRARNDLLQGYHCAPSLPCWRPYGPQVATVATSAYSDPLLWITTRRPGLSGAQQPFSKIMARRPCHVGAY